MRSVKITLGLAAAVFALAATSAAAHNFTASIVGKTISPTTPAKLKGKGVGNQTFVFGAIKITCPIVSTTGSVSEEAPQVLKITAKYKGGGTEPGTGCETAIKVGAEPTGLPTKFVKPIEYAFNANGIEAENGVEGEEGSLEVGANSAEIKVSGIKCLVVWPAQKIPMKLKKVPAEVAVFSSEEVANAHMRAFPTGFQKKLLITPDFDSLTWSYEEGRCTEFKKVEGISGGYEGTLSEEVAGGNLGRE